MPPQMKDAREVEATLASWPETYRRLESVLSEKLSNAGQVAGVTSMLPKRAQVYAHLDAKDSWNPG